MNAAINSDVLVNSIPESILDLPGLERVSPQYFLKSN